LPGDGWAASMNGHGEPPLHGEWRVHENVVRHSVTQVSLEVDVAVYQCDMSVINKCHTDDTASDNRKKGEVGLADVGCGLRTGIEDAGLPTLFKKAVRWAEKHRREV